MDSDDEVLNPALAADRADLWSAVLALGEVGEAYDAGSDTTSVAFARGPDWKEALNHIRKTLKKYHTSPTLPARRWLASWGVLTGRLLPMLARYTDDRRVQ